MQRTTIALMLVAVIVLTGGGCGEATPRPAERTTIAVVPSLFAVPLYVAYDKGYFSDEGLDVNLQSYASGPQALDALFSGRADFATAADTPMARAAVDGKPMAVIATIAENDQAVLVVARKDRGISGVEDLRGKRVGLALGTAAEFFLHIFLTTSYVSPRDVQTVNIAADEVVDALVKGEVDAVSTWAPYTLVLQDQLGPNAVVLGAPGIYAMNASVTVRHDFAANNPERIKGFLRAILRSNTFIREHPDEARVITAKYMAEDSSLYAREWNDYSFVAELDQSLILNLEGQARWMIRGEAGGVRRTPNFLDFIYADGLKAVQPGAVTVPGK